MTKWRNTANLSRIQFGIAPLVVLVLLVMLWEFTASHDDSLKLVISSPSQVAATMIHDQETLLSQHIPQTLLETLTGLGLALVGGVAIAALLDFSPLLKRAIYPLLVISQTIPIVALGTVLILIFGFGDEPKIIVVLLYCFFPITVATIDGLTSTDPDLVALLRAMGASRWQVWRKVRFPAALPALFSGVRIAATYSVGSAIIAEYITSDRGLGYYLRSAFKSYHPDQAFAGIVIAAALSIALVITVEVIERIMLPWYHTSARHWNEPGIY